MDMGDPTRSITPTLDGPVLAALARSGRPLTVGEVAAETVRGSEIGVRRCLARLVAQGLVQATEMGRNRVHELNREHVAAPIATMMDDLRIELWRRMRKELGGWKPKPLYACVFGSAARAEGDADSDVDLLLVHPRAPVEWQPTPGCGSLVRRMGGQEAERRSDCRNRTRRDRPRRHFDRCRSSPYESDGVVRMAKALRTAQCGRQ